MNNWRVLTLVFLAVLALAAGGCGSDDENRDNPNSAVRTIENGAFTSVTLVGGTTVNFPANTFTNKVTLLIADIFTSSDAISTYFPTTSKLPGDLLGGMVINTPVDELFKRDISVQFELRDFTTTSQVIDVSPGDDYAVYRFDFDNLRWNRWHDTFVTVDGSRTVATGTLPTDEFRGFIGSIAIFRDHEVTSLPAVMDTTVSGRVLDSSGNGVATDVGLYILVGALKYPAAVDNGRIPALSEPTDSTLPISVANTVDSDALGNFTFEIPDNLIGQQINFEFGHEETGRVYDNFEVLAPATPNDDLDFMVIRYGENNILSERVPIS